MTMSDTQKFKCEKCGHKSEFVRATYVKVPDDSNSHDAGATWVSLRCVKCGC